MAWPNVKRMMRQLEVNLENIGVKQQGLMLSGMISLELRSKDR